DAKETTTGERVGPYPDMASLLTQMGQDLLKGDLLFVDDATTPLFDLAGAAERVEVKPLRSDVRCPDPTRGDTPDGERAPAKLAGEVVAQFLRLTITNVGATPITIDPVALRYGTAEWTKHEVYGGPGGAKTYQQLALQLGFVRASPATPADRLVTLAP